MDAVLALATANATFLYGTCLAQISCLWPSYERHEAGHLLTGMAFTLCKLFVVTLFIGSCFPNIS